MNFKVGSSETEGESAFRKAERFINGPQFKDLVTAAEDIQNDYEMCGDTCIALKRRLLELANAVVELNQIVETLGKAIEYERPEED